MKIRIKIQGALMFLGLSVVIIFSNFVFARYNQAIFEPVLNAIGMIFILFGFFFRIISRGYKEEKSYNGNTLVKDGPYDIIRNPMYFGTVSIGTGVVVMLFEWWVFFLFASVFLLIYIPQIKKEEAELLKNFGMGYLEYYKRTPGYFPKIGSLLDPDNYKAIKPLWVKKEIISMVVTITIVLFMEICRMIFPAPFF